MFALNEGNKNDESLWPQPDRLGRSIRGFKQAHVIFEKTIGAKKVISELTSNPNRIWLLSTPEQPVVNIGLRKVCSQHVYSINCISSNTIVILIPRINNQDL